jgi:hypothetical protein
MNDFLRGMATIGELAPKPVPFNEYPSQRSEWQSVANSFAQAGHSLWLAFKEGSNKCLVEKQAGATGVN